MSIADCASDGSHAITYARFTHTFACTAIGNGVVSGTSIAPSSDANQLLVTTAPGSAAWTPLTDCAADGLHAVTYSASAHTFACSTLTTGPSLTVLAALTAISPASSLVNLSNPDAATVGALNCHIGQQQGTGGFHVSGLIPANSGGTMSTLQQLFTDGQNYGIARFDHNQQFQACDLQNYPAGSTFSIPARTAFIATTTQDSVSPYTGNEIVFGSKPPHPLLPGEPTASNRSIRCSLRKPGCPAFRIWSAKTPRFRTSTSLRLQ